MRKSTTSSGDRAVAWARVYAAISRTHSKSLRHGTWYPVVAADMPDRVALRVGTELMTVPRNLLEIREKRPVFFSVVTRPNSLPDGSGPAPSESKRYLVCPDCDHRNPFFGEPERTSCKKCGYEGEIAWWDS